jgi:hypothetical protein
MEVVASCQHAQSFQTSDLAHSNLSFQGVDLDGVSALGGVLFFNIAVETPNGDFALLEKVLEGANTEVDESAEERKGGAG